MNILNFSKKDSFALILIFTFLISLTSFNMLGALRKARDSERKNDIRTIYDALSKYNDEFSFYPLSSENGRILACKGEINEFGFPEFAPCEYGLDSLRDIYDESYAPYLKTIPRDPYFNRGFAYFYISTGKNFQLYAHLEGTDQDEYNPKIADLKLPCGTQICNFGLANAGVPLDKSLQEYENELQAKNEASDTK